MANYKVNPDKKTVIVNGALSAIEKSIIATYIGEGFTVKEARKDTTKRIDNDVIIAYFDSTKDEEGKK
ncbi:MAG: hypothetical protein UH641_05550, partial [Bacteroidales bacterium]|nr:hypothetical protein [Bacteroidales bacterium]